MEQPFVAFRRSTGSSITTNKTIKTKIGTWFAEFIGTFFWVLFIKLTGNPTITPLGGQYGIGFGLLVLVYQFGYKSGAHFNPCVCIGLLCRGSLPDFPINDYQNIIMYIVSQISGGLLGGFVAWSITDNHQCQSVYFYPKDPFQWEQAMGAEFLFTFLLVFVIINVATSQQPNQFYGLSIGWTLFVAIGAIGNISGCSLNIAVYFGTIIPATACADDINNIKWKYWWVYIIGDIAGAICAGLLYRFLFIERKLRRKKFQKLLTELIGTFFLVAIVKLASYSASITGSNGGIIAVETIGFGLIILTYLFGYIGGDTFVHFNPSISFGIYITQQDFTTIDFLSYVCVQTIGGTLGGLFVYGIGGTRIGQQRITFNHDRFYTSQAFFAEVAFTFLLVNCVLNVATSAIKKNYFYGLAIGSSLGAAVCAIGINGLSGACLNFAVFFGSNVSALIAGVEWDDLRWIHLWIYCVAPLVGAGIAGILYKYLYQDFDLESEVEYAGERNKHRLRRYVAEFIGTGYLVCIIKLVSASYPKDDISPHFVPNITSAVGVGFGLISLIYSFGYISQGHFNPAITIGVWLHGDIEGFEFDDYMNIAIYIIMQLLGGFVGGLCAWSLGHDNAGRVYPHIHFEKEDYQVFGAEFIFTFLLVLLLIINVTLTKPKNTGIPCTSSGISVGWMVMAAIGAIGTVDAVNGCCLNPAVWFGTIMSAACSTNDISNIKFEYIWVYVVSEILAGIAVGLLVRYLWKDQERRETVISKYIAEFFGTFFLVCFIKLAISNQATHKHLYDQPILSIGFGLVILIYCFGSISGAHFNPAISLGVYCRGNVDGFYPKQYKNVLFYILSQLLGGLFGGMFSWGITGKNQCYSVYPYVDTNKLFGSGTEKAFGAELIFTFLLVSSVIHTGIEQQPNDFYAMTIGFTRFVASQLIAPISGACLNPAVWFGTIISAAMCVNHENQLKWGQLWIYLGAPIIGSIIAGFIYRLLYYEPDIPRAINEPVLGDDGGDDVLTNRDIWAAGNSPRSDRL